MYKRDYVDRWILSKIKCPSIRWKKIMPEIRGKGSCSIFGAFHCMKGFPICQFSAFFSISFFVTSTTSMIRLSVATESNLAYTLNTKLSNIVLVCFEFKSNLLIAFEEYMWLTTPLRQLQNPFLPFSVCHLLVRSHLQLRSRIESASRQYFVFYFRSAPHIFSVLSGAGKFDGKSTSDICHSCRKNYIRYSTSHAKSRCLSVKEKSHIKAMKFSSSVSVSSTCVSNVAGWRSLAGFRFSYIRKIYGIKFISAFSSKLFIAINYLALQIFEYICWQFCFQLVSSGVAPHLAHTHKHTHSLRQILIPA